MSKVDNIDLIKPLLKFTSEDDYYFLQVIQRKKDGNSVHGRVQGSNNSSRLIKAYNINSIEYLENRYEEIKALCELFNARAGICLNKRSYKSSTLQMMVRLAQSVQGQNYRNAAMWNNVSGVYHPIKDKVWIVDIDKDEIFFKDNIIDCIHESDPVGNKIVAEIPSKSRYHLITKPFNVLIFRQKYKAMFEEYQLYEVELDIHKNNPTNLYIP